MNIHRISYHIFWGDMYAIRQINHFNDYFIWIDRI